MSTRSVTTVSKPKPPRDLPSPLDKSRRASTGGPRRSIAMGPTSTERHARRSDVRPGAGPVHARRESRSVEAPHRQSPRAGRARPSKGRGEAGRGTDDGPRRHATGIGVHGCTPCRKSASHIPQKSRNLPAERPQWGSRGHTAQQPETPQNRWHSNDSGASAQVSDTPGLVVPQFPKNCRCQAPVAL